MKRLGRQTSRTRRDSGFTLLEMAMVLAIMMIMGVITVVSLQPVWKNNTVNNAYDDVLMSLRNARQAAVNERHVYLVTFNNNTQYTIQRLIGGNNGVVDPVMNQVRTLPRPMQFLNLPSIPNVNSQTPDNQGVGAFAIQFDMTVGGGNRFQIFFQPDGSARDINMNINNGIAYIADPTDLYSSRAVTLMGAVGRLRGWRLIPRGGQPTWLQQ